MADRAHSDPFNWRATPRPGALPKGPREAVRRLGREPRKWLSRRLVLVGLLSMAASRAARGWPADAAIAALLAGVAVRSFASAPSGQYSFDAIAYAWQIEQYHLSGNPNWLLHPHHLLFNLTGYLWWRLLHGLLGLARPLEAQQMLSACAGGAAIALCYAAARQATGSRLLALAAAVLTGSGFGFWLIATDGGIYALGFALCVAAIWLALRLAARPTPRRAMALGAAAALAALIHQMHLLLGPVVVAAPLLCRPAARPAGRARINLLLATLLPYGTLLLGSYAAAGWVRGYGDLEAFAHWVTAYAHDGRWWDFDLANNLRLDLRALACVFAAEPDRLLARIEWLLDDTCAAYEAHVWWFGAAGAPAAILLGRVVWRQRRPLLIALLWLAPYAAFFTVWVPGYYAYWVPMAFALLLVSGLLVEGGLRTLRPTRLRAGVGGLVRAGVLGLACLGAVKLWEGHGERIVRRQNESANPCLLIAREVSQNTEGSDPATGRGADLLLITGTGHYAYLETYIPYFARRNVVTLAQALKHHGTGQGRTREEALRWLREQILQSWSTGADVYVCSDVAGSPAALEVLEERYGLAPAEVQEFLREFRLEPAFSVRGQLVYRLCAVAEEDPLD